MRRDRNWIVMVAFGLVALVTGGCGVLNSLLGGGADTRSPDAQGRVYAGAACGEVLYPLEDSDYLGQELSTKPTEDPRLEVLLGVCHRGERVNTTQHRIEQNPRYSVRDHLERHREFDDRRDDALQAALLLSYCASNECHAFTSYELQPGPQVVTKEDAEAGMLFSYAALLDSDELQASLEGLDLERGASQAFFARVTATSQQLRETVEAMPEAKRELVAGIPIDVRRERAEYFGAHAELYAELDELAATLEQARASGTIAPETLVALRALRGRYAAQCEDPSCRFDPFYVSVTHELAMAHLAVKAPLDLVVESRLLMKPESLRRHMAEAIDQAQTQRVNEASEARNTLREAREKGLDEVSTAALVGDVVPLEVDLRALWSPGFQIQAYDELIDTKSVGQVQSYVAAVKKKGDRAEIRFKGSSYQSMEPFGCRRTNRIERIDANGRVEYEEHCKYRKVTRRVPPKPSIIVPASETEGIRVGELVDAYVSGKDREGRILSVHAGDELELVQWLGDRFGS